MSITAFLVALCFIAIVCIVASAIVRLAPLPPPVPVLIWAVAAILCVLILLNCIEGWHTLTVR